MKNNDKKMIDNKEKSDSKIIIEDDNKNQSKEKNHKFLSKISAILLVLILVTYVGLNFSYISLDETISYVKTNMFGINKGNGFPYTINGNNINNNNIKKLGADFFYVSDVACCSINNTAGEVFFLQHGFSSPVLLSNNNKCIVYGVKSPSFMIIDKNYKTEKITLENDIYTMAINKNGYYAVVSESESYLSKLALYDDNMEMIYQRDFVDYYITSVEINNDNKTMVFSGLYVENGKIKTKIMISETTSKDIIKEYIIDNCIISEIKYLSNGNIVCVGDTSSCVIFEKTYDIKTIPYNNMILSNSYIDINKGLLLSLIYNKNDKNAYILKINNKAEVVFEKQLNYEVKNISFDNKKIYTLSLGEIIIYDELGEKLEPISCDINSRFIFLNGRNKLYITSRNKIYNYSL